MGKLLVEEREIVVPGQEIAEGMDYLPGEGTFREKDKFSRMSPKKQHELGSHIIIEMPAVCDSTRVSLYDMCSLLDNTGLANYTLAYISGIRQGFPVYPDVPEHVKKTNTYLSNMLFSAMQMKFPNDVFVVNDKCYITMNVVLAVTDVIAEAWSTVYNTEVADVNVVDMEGDTWSISVLQNDTTAWCSFIIHARRSVLKDFNLFVNSSCTNISSFNKAVLSRRNTRKAHLVTIFDLISSKKQMNNMLCEKATLEIVNKLIEYGKR